MSSIAWVLLITVNGCFGMPVQVAIMFDTEVQCERAKDTVSARDTHQLQSRYCEPVKGVRK